jgi:uncharacterized phage infection (PIP) family protein YhgE
MILLLISNFSFGDTTEELANRLEESNKVITELIQTVTEKNDKIKKLEKSISEKSSEIENLGNQSQEKSKKIENLTDRLEESNDIITELTNRIRKDQEEITMLRDLLDNTSRYVEDQTNFLVGGNLTYPLGGQIFFGVDINGLPIGVYSTFLLQENYYISGGIGVIFEL